MSTTTTVADLNPKTLDNAKRRFVELYGSALVMNTYLKVALVIMSLVAAGLLILNFRTAARAADLKPLVIRIDDVGRAEAVQYDAATYHPEAPEMRYFLTQFVIKYFSRIRATVEREYPQSLFFLSPSLAQATVSRDEQNRTVEAFLGNPSADEIDVVIDNVSLTQVAKPPYEASVAFQKVFYAPGMGAEERRESDIAQIDFRFRNHVPNTLIPINPLGLEITYFRIDQAFNEPKP